MSITGIPGNIPYQGIKERNPPELHISRTRSPNASDSGPQFKIGDIWVDSLAGSFFVLLSKDQGVADWAVGGGAGSGVLTVNTILPDGAGDFTILGGTNVTVTPGANSITISSLDVGATSFPADAGTANEAAGVLNILGGPGVDTTGAANTISINIAGDVARFYDVDLGGPAVPTLNTLTIVGPSSSDFPSSGIETNVGATTNEIYLENVRFPSAFVVDANTAVGNRGEFTTLTAAAAAMSAGDTMYVRPGTYNENWTPLLGTNVVGLSAIGQGGSVVIAGTTNAPVGAGTTVMQNIEFSTGGGVAIECQGGAGSNMIFIDCNSTHTSNALRWVSGNVVANRCTFTSSADSALVSETTGGGTGTFEDCNFVSAPGFATVVQSIAATMNLNNCNISGGDESVLGQAGTMNFQECQLSPGMNLELVTVNFDHSSIDALGATTGASIEAGTTFTGRFSRITSPGEQAFEVNGAATINLYKMIIDAGSGGNWIDVIPGATLDYSDVSLLGDVGIGTGGTITSTQWKPHGDVAGNVGVNSYLAADFAVDATGVVSSLSTASETFPVDNGGPGVPLAGAMSFVDSTSSDFANSGLETHVGATANEIYIENRRFPAAIVVDATTTVGDRGTHSTITAGLAAASAGDTVYVRPGTYTENFVVPIGISLIGLSGSGENEQVDVAGTINAAVGAGTTLIQNLFISGSGSKAFELNGGAGSFFYIIDCKANHATQVSRQVSGTVILNRCTFTASGAGSNWDVEAGQVLATDTTFNSGTSTCVDLAGVGTGSVFENCQMTSTGSSAITQNPATQSYRADNCQISRTGGGNVIGNGNGTSALDYCQIEGDVEQANGTITMTHCDISGSFQTDDATVTFHHCDWGQEVNCDDAVTLVMSHCRVHSDFSSCVSIGGGAGGTGNISNCSFDTATSPAIFVTAADTLEYSHISFESNSEMSGGGVFTQYPLPCSFHAFLPATVAGATGAGAVFTLGTTTVLTERFDSGVNFVPAGTFTAPVTGTYSFTVRWVFGSLAASNDDLVCDIVTTGTTYEVTRLNIDAISNPANEAAVTGTVLVQMTSGDTATFTATETGGGAASVDVVGSAAGDGTYVMGWLVS